MAVLGLPGWNTLLQDEAEHAPQLQFPRSIETWDRMSTDSQIKGLRQGITLPLRRMNWMLDPQDARPEVVEALSQDLQLPIKGRDDFKRGRRRTSFSWDRHLTDLLRAQEYGFYMFEQVGEIGDDGRWHLRKLAPRPPRTISKINVATDGGLESVEQNFGIHSDPISVNRLIAYVWDQEAGNWFGKSMYRSLYRPYTLKDRAMRAGGLLIEKAGMGVPTVVAPEGATADEIAELNQQAAEVKMGERAAGSWPHGTSFSIEGVRGTLPDAPGFIRLMNEEMARAFLMMFMQLGQTGTGSRATGDNFLDVFDDALDAMADWVVDIFTAHMIEDWVDWNFGRDEPAPALCYEQPDEAGIADLAMLVDKGLVVVDPELRGMIRQRYRLPEETEPDPVPPVAAKAKTPVKAAAGDLREPTEPEVTATTDFEAMDAQLTSAVDSLVQKLTDLRAAQITELAEQIIAADGELALLAALQASPVGADEIAEAMRTMAQAGIDQVMAEAARQGLVSAATPSIGDLEDALVLRANATSSLLARSISDAAARQAVARTAEALTPGDVAAAVTEYLNNLSDAYLTDQATGVIVQGQNTGRKSVMFENEAEIAYVYASEILDGSTCDECAEIDGTEWTDLTEAEAAYPAGGFVNCLGGPRCRGTLVAVFKSETEPSVQ